MRLSIIGLISVFAFLSIVGCGYTLTKGQAAAIIERSKEMATLQLTKEEFEKGAQAGFWQWESGGGKETNPFDLYTFRLTPAGMKIFEGGGRPRYGGVDSVTLRAPITRRVLAVNRLSKNGNGRRIAEIVWQWDFDSLPGMGSVINNSHQFAAVWFVYSSGWEIESIKPNP